MGDCVANVGCERTGDKVKKSELLAKNQEQGLGSGGEYTDISLQ